MADEVQRHSDSMSIIRDMAYAIRTKASAMSLLGQSTLASQMECIATNIETSVRNADKAFNDMFSMWYKNVDAPSNNLIKGIMAGITMKDKFSPKNEE